MFNWRGLFVESFRGDATMNPRGISRVMGNPDILRQRGQRDQSRPRETVEVSYVGTSRRRRDGCSSPTRVDIGYRFTKKLCRVLDPGEVEDAALHTDPGLN